MHKAQIDEQPQLNVNYILYLFFSYFSKMM